MSGAVAAPAQTSAVPGPSGWPVLGSLPAFYRDPLGFVREVSAAPGDIHRISVVGLPYYQLSNPEHIRYVLQNYKLFRKGDIGRERRRLFGKGLATAEGDFWLRQRHLSQPAFSRERLQTYGQTMAAIGARRIPAWPTGTPVDIHGLLMRLALENIAKVLFNANVDEEAEQVGHSLEYAMRFFGSQASFIYHLLPKWFMTPGRRRFHREVDELDRVIGGIVAARRASGEDAGDLLSMLISARDESDGAMDDQQLRDELMTLFLAGHETTALALSWSVGLLVRHPAIADALAADIDQLLGGRDPTVDDLPALVGVEQVLKEAMRIYPPAWILARQAVQDVEIGGVRIPRRAFVTLSQWVNHHDPQYFPEPKAFRPERWTADFEKSLPKFTYYPFGAGPRGCIGKALSMIEATLFLTMILQRFRLLPAPGFALRPEASLSLRPRGGVRVILQPRGAA